MLRERLLRMLHARSSSRARSHAHRRFPVRAGLHLLLIAMVALAAVLTAQLASDPEPSQAVSIPPVPLSGVRAVVVTGEELLRPGVSHGTRESPLRESLPPAQGAQLRPTDNIKAGETFSDSFNRVTGESRDEGYEQRPVSEQIDPTAPYVFYEVRAGDTLSGIADTYRTTVENILFNNAEVDEGGWIAPGQQILVPFDTGILYLVGQGETLSGIIDNYLEVTVEDVLAYRPNNLSDAGDVRPGDYVLLPNAERKPPPVYSEGGVILGYYGVPQVSDDRFGLPLPIWDFVSDTYGTYRGADLIHEGIDLALGGYPASSVYASCDGWVSRTEWLTYSYGYYVVVNCGEGWETLYAHFSEIGVSWGDTVTKGATILGISGSTGYSTGEHLHFEIHYDGAPLDPEKYLNFY